MLVDNVYFSLKFGLRCSDNVLILRTRTPYQLYMFSVPSLEILSVFGGVSMDGDISYSHALEMLKHEEWKEIMTRPCSDAIKNFVVTSMDAHNWGNIHFYIPNNDHLFFLMVIPHNSGEPTPFYCYDMPELTFNRRYIGKLTYKQHDLEHRPDFKACTMLLTGKDEYLAVFHRTYRYADAIIVCVPVTTRI